jgi:hypothetical protein
MLMVTAPPLPRMGEEEDATMAAAEPPPRRDWLDLYNTRVPAAAPAPRPCFFWAPPGRRPAPAAAANDDDDSDASAADALDYHDDDPQDRHHISDLQQRLPDEVLLNVMSRLGGPDAPYALARVALVCRHFRLLAAAPMLWERSCYLAFTAPAFQAGIGRRVGGGGGGIVVGPGGGGMGGGGGSGVGGGGPTPPAGDLHAVAQAVWAPSHPSSSSSSHHHHRRRATAAAPLLQPPSGPPVAAAFAAGPAAVQRLLATRHLGSWRHLYLSTPRPRTDGLYVSRNTYVRVGVRELRSASGNKTCHLVAYFRYWLFLPGTGRLVYRTSPLPPARVARGMARLGAAVERGGEGGGGGWWAGGDGEDDDDEAVAAAQQQQQQQSSSAKGQGQQQQQQQQQQQHALVGKHAVRGTSVLCAVTYPNARRTEIRTRLELRCSSSSSSAGGGLGAGVGGGGGGPGSWNRLDVKSIESFDREDGTSAPLDGGRRDGQEHEEEEDEDDALWQAALGVEAAAGVSAEARRMHRRGLSPAVFVPWGEVLTTRLNDPPSKMDVFIPG